MNRQEYFGEFNKSIFNSNAEISSNRFYSNNQDKAIDFKSKLKTRREFLKEIGKIAALFGLSSVTELFSSCSLLTREELLSTKLSKAPDKLTLKEIKFILQEIPLYVELKQNSLVTIKIKENEEIYEKFGAVAGWMGGFDLTGVQGTLYFYPFEKLTNPIDKQNYYSMIYHEIVHIKQDWQLFNYFLAEDLDNIIPRWKMKFYYAQIPELKIKHIGMEIDAYYEQILFSKKRSKNIPFLALYGFFYTTDTIHSTETYKKYPQIREYVEKLEQTVENISGYTREQIRLEAKEYKDWTKHKD